MSQQLPSSVGQFNFRGCGTTEKTYGVIFGNTVSGICTATQGTVSTGYCTNLNMSNHFGGSVIMNTSSNIYKNNANVVPTSLRVKFFIRY